MAYARVSGDLVVQHEGLKTAYQAILCFGVVAVLLSLAYRLHNARLVRVHVVGLGQQGRAVRVSKARRQARQHEFELAQTHRTKFILSLTLFSVVAQGALPLRAAADA
jgi:hypothetical protein